MKYRLELNDRPFDAIAARTKKVEGRVPTDHTRHIPYDKLTTDDTLEFYRKSDQVEMEVRIIFVHHYPDVRSMLESEGVENVLSGNRGIEEGIKSYHSYTDYEKNIERFGIYAIGVEPIKNA